MRSPSGQRGYLQFVVRPARYCGIVMSTLSICASTAHADSRVDQAKTLFNAGAHAYDAGQYAAAAQAFEQAYQLAPRAGILFSQAQAWRKQYFIDRQSDSLRRAIKLYRDYLSSTEQGGRRADAAQALAELEPIASRLEPNSPSTPPKPPQTRIMISAQHEDARISLDGGEPVAAPLIAEVKPGKHHVRVTAQGHFPEERDVAAAEGAVMALDVVLHDKPARLRLEGSPGADVSVDGRSVGRTPFAAPIEVAAGHHVIAVAKNGHEAVVEEVEVRIDETRRIHYDLKASGQRKFAWGMLIGAGAAVVFGGVSTGLAMHQQSRARDVTDSRGQRNISEADAAAYDDAIESRDRWRNVAIVSFGTAAALGVTGALLYGFDYPIITGPVMHGESSPKPPPRPRSEPSSLEVSASPWFTTTTVGLGLSAKF